MRNVTSNVTSTNNARYLTKKVFVFGLGGVGSHVQTETDARPNLTSFFLEANVCEHDPLA